LSARDHEFRDFSHDLRYSENSSHRIQTRASARYNGGK
jgi:hypothetical protein